MSPFVITLSCGNIFSDQKTSKQQGEQASDAVPAVVGEQRHYRKGQHNGEALPVAATGD